MWVCVGTPKPHLLMRKNAFLPSRTRETFRENPATRRTRSISESNQQASITHTTKLAFWVYWLASTWREGRKKEGSAWKRRYTLLCEELRRKQGRSTKDEEKPGWPK
ncbi:hypothetical protein ZHAS_00018324 [Anopheles sinensis]|uniref:Uncharacterized protein n=1 Tax=Anopheles sinensis TaxID=74873 RepID=A0A084WJ54_ANOSI|nr:hypothetical protein ZHAS_00018324 [Anopheles sinensis]